MSKGVLSGKNLIMSRTFDVISNFRKLILEEMGKSCWHYILDFEHYQGLKNFSLKTFENMR